MSNKNIIEQRVAALGYKLGCYSEGIEKMSRYSLNKVLKQFDEEYADVDVLLNRQPYVVEIATVDNEKDIVLLSKSEYIARYGSERWRARS